MITVGGEVTYKVSESIMGVTQDQGDEFKSIGEGDLGGLGWSPGRSQRFNGVENLREKCN